MAQIQTGFFTHEIQLRRLDNLGDPLKGIGEVVDFEMFRPLLDRLFGVRAAGPGRPLWDCVLMFRILVLQIVRGLSDEKLKFDLVDSASAQRFAELSPHDAVPDSRTVWLLRDTLAKSQVPPEEGSGEGTDGARTLFELVHRELAAKGLLCREQRLAAKELSESQKESNRIKSKVRARIEHRFGRMRTTLKGLAMRSIGLLRCRAAIGLLNLVYNLMEYARLCPRATTAA